MIQIAPGFADVRTRYPIALARSTGRAALLMLLLTTPRLSSAQTPRLARPAIRLEQVVVALDMAMLPLEKAVVRLLAENTATSSEPGLEVRGLEPWGDRGARVRMGCAAHEQCLPFYVAVDWADSTVAKAALKAASLVPAGASRQSASTQSAFGQGFQEPGGPAKKPAPTVSVDREVAEKPGAGTIPSGMGTTVHPGSRAMLLIDGQRVHIKVPVICLESGAPGRTIRVTALDHKQTYRAEIIDGTLLKTSL